MGELNRIPEPYTARNELNLISVMQIIKKQYRMIIILTFLITLTTAILNFLIFKPVYQAKTLLMVTVASEKLEVNDNLIIKPGDNTALKNQAAMPVLTMNTYLGQLQSEVLMKRILETLELEDLTISHLSDMIEASIVKDSNLIEVKVNHNQPEMARLIANTLAYQYLGLMEEFMFSSVVVISPANTPTIPIKPHKVLNTALAFMLAIILSVVLAVILERLDNTLKTAEDVVNELNTPLLGIIPAHPERIQRIHPCLITVQKPHSVSSEAFRTLRTNLGFAGIERPFRSILVTSPQALDGKSTVIANLAVVMAQAGHKVLLVDCDLRKPQQHKLFDLPNQTGFTTCLARKLKFSTAAAKIELNNLWVLPSGPIPPNPAELLNSSRVQMMWNQLLQEYDYVLIDSSPVLAVTDPTILSTQADAVIMVVRSEFTRSQAALQARDQLARADARLLGVILNHVKVNNYSFYTYS